MSEERNLRHMGGKKKEETDTIMPVPRFPRRKRGGREGSNVASQEKRKGILPILLSSETKSMQKIFSGFFVAPAREKRKRKGGVR